MKKLFLALLLSLMTLPAMATETCYADYKAKKDNPLRLAYGVFELPQGVCDISTAGRLLDKHLSRDGYALLTVEGIFTQTGLASRKEAAGAHFLRY